MLLGVPRDVQIPKMVLQDTRMCPQKPKKRSKISAKSSQQASKLAGGAGGRGEACRYTYAYIARFISMEFYLLKIC